MIEGKVAAIVDGFSIVVNVGKLQGVRPGMRFKAIYKTDRIVDPDDPRNVLDGLTFIIGELEATSVLERFTYCKVDSPAAPSLNLGFLNYVGQKESIVDPNELQLAPQSEFKIKVGTIVREAPKQEPDTPRTSAPPKPQQN